MERPGCVKRLPSESHMASPGNVVKSYQDLLFDGTVGKASVDKIINQRIDVVMLG